MTDETRDARPIYSFNSGVIQDVIGDRDRRIQELESDLRAAQARERQWQEREAGLRTALAKAAIPLEVMMAQILEAPYREITPQLQREICRAVRTIRAALTPDAPNPVLEELARLRGALEKAKNWVDMAARSLTAGVPVHAVAGTLSHESERITTTLSSTPDHATQSRAEGC